MTEKTKQLCSYLILLLVLLIAQIGRGQIPKISKNSKKPNIIFILTDDLGYGDVGVFFQNQRREKNDKSEPWMYTPNLDKMALEGAILPQHYAAAPVCAPSRASLLSGLSQGHANVRNNQFDKALADNYTLANVLKKAGYKTAAIGKWGLQGDDRWNYNGNQWPARPTQRGFDYFFGYMRHKDGHEHYPKEGLYDSHKEVWENDKEISNTLDKCYTTDLWTAAAKNWIISQEKNQEKQPFFLYLAYDTPHAVLELPTQAYPKGGGLEGGIQWIGNPGYMINTASGTPDSWIHPDYENATYDDDTNNETPAVPWPETFKRYATSIRRIDNAVGDLLKLLKDLKIDKNTLVVFTSDNGPSKESYLPKKFVPNNPSFFNSFGPFDGIKRDVLEGGERMPTIVRWPARIPENKVDSLPSISYDWLPTFTDAAGLPAPTNSDGTSILPSLTGKDIQKKKPLYVEYFHGGKTPNYKEFSPQHRGKARKQMQMIRLGNLLGLRYNTLSASDDFEIYNILNDPKQEKNLAPVDSMLKFQKIMRDKVLQMRLSDTSARRPYDTAMIPSVKVHPKKHGISWKAFNGDFPWLPEVSQLPISKKGIISKVEVENWENKPYHYYLFSGYLKVPNDGEYSFYLSANSKAFLRIHEIGLIDEDFGYVSNTEKKATIKLEKGFHPIRIYYQNDSGSANHLEFKWEGPSMSKHSIRNKFLYR